MREMVALLTVAPRFSSLQQFLDPRPYVRPAPHPGYTENKKANRTGVTRPVTGRPGFPSGGGRRHRAAAAKEGAEQDQADAPELEDPVRLHSQPARPENQVDLVK